ncbi:unnamed protein product [Cladocopium goreaui]|uniref:E3 ubiquitin-protein ligase HERC2 n=1 Tax=Cladocopium goreaui TaxID=2562237 RepID=A0A9P1BT94_9DINO|nr:unnamed protein product [Cladocopium goreaui]
MQRTSFDVNSIAALLRQTEANLAALKPRQEAQRYSGEPIFSSTLPYTSSAPVRSQLGSGVELETQVVQLRTCIETLERRLEEELRSFLAISDKRLQAREEQLRGIGETLQASADAAMEQLNRRVDTRLHDLERAGLAPSALDEIWEALKRLEGDCQDLDGKLRRAASADDLADRFKEVERAQVQRFDERLATQEKRMSDMRLQLQTANEEFLQAINRRCEVLEKIVWEGQTDKGDIETVFKRLAEAAPIREMQEEINACNYEKEVQRTRLTTLEAKLSKQAALESKVDFMESQTSQQLEEQAQKFRHVSELQHKLSQKLASTEAASQRVEAQGASLQAKLQSQLDEERERMHSSFDALQQRVTKQLEEVEGRASRGSKRSEQDLVEHVNALTQKLMEESIAAQKQAEKRLHTVDERSDQVIQAARSQMEKAIQDLKMDAEVAKNAMDADLQRMDRFVQEIGSKMSTQEGQLVRLSDMDIQRSRIEAMESKLNEVQGEQRLLRDLKSIMDAHKLQADRRLGDLDSALASIEEQIREKDRRRNNDVDAHRARFEGFENRLTELQVSQVRHKTSVENLDIAVTSLEPLRATVTTLQGGLAAVEERIRSRAQAPHASSQASQGPKPGFDKPRRQRVTGKPATARASARSKDDEIQKVFNDIDTGGSGVLTLEDLQSYLCDHLGFGQAEAFGFMKTFGQGDGVSMEGFKKGYARLTPFLLSKRQNEVLIRKDGSLSSMGPQSLQIEELDDCEVYICEVTNTIFVDECKRCAMLIGPCETSVFVRDCEDCVFWIAAQQLRTRGCKRCKFFLYSKQMSQRQVQSVDN